MTKKKYILWTEKKLDKFFEDNSIEDDGLFDFLKGREAILEMHTNIDLPDNDTELTIKTIMREL